MIIHILRGQPAQREQILDMLQANRFYIKTVIDIRLQILAGGGDMHRSEERRVGKEC